MVLTSIVPWIGPQPVEFGAEFIPVPREGLPFSLVVLILVIPLPWAQPPQLRRLSVMLHGATVVRGQHRRSPDRKSLRCVAV